MNLETLSEVIQNTKTIVRLLRVHPEMTLHGGMGFRARIRELLAADDNDQTHMNMTELLEALRHLDRAVKTLREMEIG